jgi:hypothetical protein
MLMKMNEFILYFHLYNVFFIKYITIVNTMNKILVYYNFLYFYQIISKI